MGSASACFAGSNLWGDSMRLWPAHWRLVSYSVIAASICLSQQIGAQTTTSGALTGVITDQTNAILPDASVEIRDSAKGTTQSTKTDRDGAYQFAFLAPGKYMLIVWHDGFREERRTADVLLGPPVTVNIVLRVATATSEVRVSDEVPLIKAENGDVSETLDQKQVSELPNQGNDLTNVVQIAPGVVMNTQNSAAPFSILGMPGTSYLLTIDGLRATENGFHNQLTGPLALVMGLNQIEEASVVSTGYSGQFGGAAGGNITYITKSGSAQFHGNAEYYWNGTILNANNYFLNAAGLERPVDVANQWAGSLGGPIKKDKLFFFVDSEGLRVTVPQILFLVTPSPEFQVATLAHIRSLFGVGLASDKFYQQVFDLYNATPGANRAMPGSGTPGDPSGCTGFQDPNDENGFGHGNVPCAVHFFNVRSRPSQDTLTAGRLDWNISNTDRAFLRVQYEDGHAATHIDPISPVFDSESTAPWWQGQIAETHTWPSGASQFLLAGSSHFYATKMLRPQQALSLLPATLIFGSGNFNGLREGDAGNPRGSIYGTPLQFLISEDVMKVWRSHKVGLGASFETIRWDMWQYSFNSLGTLNPLTLDAFYQGGVDPAVLTKTDPNPDYTQLFQSFPSMLRQRMAFHSFGIYGQDEWHARKNLSLTFALRVEHQSNPTCEHDCFVRMDGPFESVSHDPNQPYNRALSGHEHAFLKMDAVLWSPRFSFAWQPLGVSRGTVLRGGIGVFYDPVPGGPALWFSDNPPLVNSYNVFNDNLAPGEKTNLLADASASNDAFVYGFNSGQTLAQIQAAVLKVSPAGFSPLSGVTFPDAVMHAAQYQKWSLELQQALGTHSSVSAAYYGFHGIHGMMQNADANAWGFGTLPAGRCPDPKPDCAPDPRFGGVATISSPAISNYNGVVTSFQHRFSRWTSGMFQINYTFGRVLDEVSNGGLFQFTHGSTLQTLDPKKLKRSYGPAEQDVRHLLNANYVWELPVKAVLGGHGPNSLVNGWQVSGTVFVRSGFPYTVFGGTPDLEQRNFYGLLYAVPVAPFGHDLPCGKGAVFTRPVVHLCQIPQVQQDGTPNPQARFVQDGCETGFDTGKLGAFPECNGLPVSFVQSRNRFRGPGYFNTDFTIMKNTKIPGWESASLGVGFQFFNVLNHPNFDLPDNFIGSGYQFFGVITGLNGPPTNLMGNNLSGDNTRRLIQVRAQLQF